MLKVLICLVLEISISVFLKTPYLTLMFTFLITLEEALKLKTKKALIFTFVSGLLYDIVTSTLFFNAVLFLFIYLIVSKLRKYFNKNLFTDILIFIIELFLYRTLSYFIIVVISVKPFSLDLYLMSIISSLILNLIFILIIRFFNVRKT